MRIYEKLDQPKNGRDVIEHVMRFNDLVHAVMLVCVAAVARRPRRWFQQQAAAGGDRGGDIRCIIITHMLDSSDVLF